MKSKLCCLHLTFISFVCSLGANSFNIAVNQPGLLILEASLDSVWIDNRASRQRIRVFPPSGVLVQQGFPEIPFFHALLEGVPQSADVQVFFGRTENLFLAYPALTPPERAKGMDVELSPRGPVGSRYPSNDFRWAPVGEADGVPVQSLEVYPVVVENLSQVRIRRQVTVRIQWDLAESYVSQASFFTGSKPNRRLQRETAPARLGIPSYQTSDHLVKIVVDTTGWYRLERSTLEDSGLAMANVDPRTFQLWYKGEEQLVWVEGEEDGLFSYDDFMLFFAEKNHSRNDAYEDNFYTNDNSYWLTWGEKRGNRYAEESGYPSLPADQVMRFGGFPTTVHIERNEIFSRLGNTGTHQTWDGFEHFFMEPPVNAGTNVRFSLYIPYPRETDDLQFSITARFQAITQDNHDVTVFVNNVKSAQGSWSGESASVISSTKELMWPNSYLLHGENDLTVSLGGGSLSRRYDQVLLDWVDVAYERLYRADRDQIEFGRAGDVDFTYQFEVDGFSSPEILIFKNGVSRIRDFVTVYDDDTESYMVIFQDWVESSNARYMAFSDLAVHNPKKVVPYEPIKDELITGGGNYLIISPTEFVPVLKPLVNHYGATVVLADEVYRQFNDGVMSPYAIKDFLRTVYRHWNPVPQYVLLVGAPYERPNDETTLPAMFYNSYRWGATSTDFWYALVDGDDYIPEFHVGRFPAKDEEELQVMVDKTMAYFAGKETGGWQNHLLMIGGYEKEFKDQSESLIGSMVADGFFVDRLYIDSFSEEGPYFGTTDTLVEGINAGRLIINFLGHGGGAIWGDRSLFTLDDIELLSNESRLPFITSMTCFTGDIVYENALGRRMVAYADGGAVAFFGSSGVGWLINDYLLVQPIMSNLLSGENVALGEIIDQGKVSYFSQNTHYPDIARSLLFQYNLIGDPALPLRLPNSSKMSVDPADPEPGERVSILIEDQTPTGVMVMLYDENNEAVHREPDIALLTSGVYLWQLPDTLEDDDYTLNTSFTWHDRVYHKSIPLKVSGSTAYIISIEPAQPTHKDSIAVTAYVSDRQGIASVTLFLSGDTTLAISMEESDTHRFRTGFPFPPQSPGSSITLWLEVVDGEGHITMSKRYGIEIPLLPDLSASDLYFKVGNDIQMAGRVENLTNGPGQVAAVLEWQNPQGEWKVIDSDTLSFEGLGTREAVFNGLFPRGVWNYQLTVNPDSSTDETDYSNNEFPATFETSSFWVTPELGTTEDLRFHSTVGVDGFAIDVPPASVSSRFPVTLSHLNELSVEYQPDLRTASFDTNYAGVQIDFSGKADSFSVAWSWATSLPTRGDLFQWYPMYQTWLRIPVDSVNHDDKVINFKANAPTRFAWFISEDVEKPRLEATVNGLRFMQDSYISPDSRISVVIEDENGVDSRAGAFKIFKNDEPYDVTLKIPESSPPNILTFQFTPNLSTQDSSLGILVKDATGNLSDTLSLTFLVKKELEVIDYGNFPNPFKDLTMFAYELTHTVDDFSLEIYSVAGQRVIRFDDETVVRDLDLRTSAYHEISWDGRDERGDFVDNGIYFYRMRARLGKAVIERFGKVAKGR